MFQNTSLVFRAPLEQCQTGRWNNKSLFSYMPPPWDIKFNQYSTAQRTPRFVCASRRCTRLCQAGQQKHSNGKCDVLNCCHWDRSSSWACVSLFITPTLISSKKYGHGLLRVFLLSRETLDRIICDCSVE